MKILPICFYGHARTKLAVHAIEQLRKHLKCTGYEIVVLFGNCAKDNAKYRAKVEAAIKAWGVKYEVFECRAPKDAVNGLNYAMNDTLKRAFSMSDVVLRLEDDWILQFDLDIGPWLDFLAENPEYGFIKLGQLCEFPVERMHDLGNGLTWLDFDVSSSRWAVNNQCGIITKAMQDIIGWYSTDVSIVQAEAAGARRWRWCMGKRPKILWVTGAEQGIDENLRPNAPFLHCGASLLGHSIFTDNIPKKYIKLQN